MAVTIEQISEWLNENEFKHSLKKEKELIISASSDENSRIAHFIRVKEDGNLFEWAIQIVDDEDEFISIKDHKFAGIALAHMLYMNYNTKFGTWEYDPSDGDMRLQVEIPLEDAVMTKKQFERIYGFMRTNAHEGAADILHILETGKVPENESEAEMLAQLEAMLELLKQSVKEEQEDVDGI